MNWNIIFAERINGVSLFTLQFVVWDSSVTLPVCESENGSALRHSIKWLQTSRAIYHKDSLHNFSRHFYNFIIRRHRCCSARDTCYSTRIFTTSGKKLILYIASPIAVNFVNFRQIIGFYFILRRERETVFNVSGERFHRYVIFQISRRGKQ